jgi:hypothetical protein
MWDSHHIPRMDSEQILEAVSNNYDQYFENREEANLVRINDETPTELHQRAVREGTGTVFNIVTEADQEYLAVFDEGIPPFHHLSHDFLLKFPIELTRLMRIRPTTLDHQHYWAWTGQVLRNSSIDEEVLDFQLIDSIMSLINLLLVTDSPLNGQNKINRIADIAMSKHLKSVKDNSLSIAAFNSYPVLEGMLKQICDDVIKPNGDIRQGERLHGVHHDYVEDDRCSSLRDLCNHTEKHAVEPHVQSVISELRERIEHFSDEDHGYEIIDGWRNSLLHGQTTFDIQAGILMNFICALIWGEIDEQSYEEQREDILESIQRSQQMPDMGHSMNVYPPD